MADNDHDPAGSTQMFRAFVNEGASDPAQNSSAGSRAGLFVAAAIVVLLLVAGAVWLALR